MTSPTSPSQCQCEQPKLYRDFSTITYRGALFCRKCQMLARSQLQ